MSNSHFPDVVIGGLINKVSFAIFNFIWAEVSVKFPLPNTSIFIPVPLLFNVLAGIVHVFNTCSDELEIFAEETKSEKRTVVDDTPVGPVGPGGPPLGPVGPVAPTAPGRLQSEFHFAGTEV